MPGQPFLPVLAGNSPANQSMQQDLNNVHLTWNEGQEKLLEAGLDATQALLLQDSLQKQNLKLEDLSRWSRDKQKQLLEDSFPMMGKVRVEAVVKNLRLIFYDIQHGKSEHVISSPRNRSAESVDQQKEVDRFPREIAEFNEAEKEINNSSRAWMDIAATADDLLTDEKAEEERSWHKTQHLYNQGTARHHQVELSRLLWL